MAIPGNFTETLEITLGGTKTAGTVEVVEGHLGMYLNDGVSGDIVPFKVRGRLDVVVKVASQVWVVGEELYWDGTGFTNIPNGTPVVAVVGAAALSAAVVGSIILITPNYAGGGETFEITTELLAASVDKWVFVAQRACKLVGIKEIHSVVGGSGAVVTPRKVLAATVAAPGAAVAAGITELTTAAIGLETTADTTQTPTLTATIADRSFAAGDKLGLNFAGTLTGLVGSATFQFQYI